MRDVGANLAVLVAYVAVVTWITWPLAPNAATGVVAGVTSMDVLYSMWAMAWVSTSLLTAPGALANAPIYHPDPQALFYWPSALGGVPFFAPALGVLAQTTGLAGIWVRTNGMTQAQRLQWFAARNGRTDLRLVAQVGGDLLFAVDTSR